MKCLVCNSNNTKEIYEKCNWYLPWTYYTVFKCTSCESHFIDPDDIDEEIYDKIYSTPQNISWYDIYEIIKQTIKSQENPLSYLWEKTDFQIFYKPIYDFFKNKYGHWLKVLDVWCWLWYMTYSINKSGNQCLWIDISDIGIQNATEEFWNYFEKVNLNSETIFFKENQNHYDVIIACEFIEHVKDVKKTIKLLYSLLAKWWTLVITTPNCDFWTLWWWVRFPELPPVHTCIISTKAITTISNEIGWNLSFFDWSKYSQSNNLREYVFRKYINTTKCWYNHVKEQLCENQWSFWLKQILLRFVNLKPIRDFSNWMFQLIWLDYKSYCAMAFYL